MVAHDSMIALHNEDNAIDLLYGLKKLMYLKGKQKRTLRTAIVTEVSNTVESQAQYEYQTKTPGALAATSAKLNLCSSLVSSRRQGQMQLEPMREIIWYMLMRGSQWLCEGRSE